MNKRNIIIFIIGIVTVLAGFFWFFYNYLKKNTSMNAPQTGNIAQVSDSGLSEKVQSLDSELNSFEDRIEGLESLSDEVLGEKVQELDATLDSIEDRLDDLEYVPMAISTFTNNVNTIEKGSTITSITFNYNFNKIPSSLNINNGIGVVTGNSVTKAVNLTTNTIYILTASDGTNAVTASSAVNFLNKAYWGTTANEVLSNEEILALANSTLVSTRNRIINLNGNGEYIYYCYPASLGNANFNIGGLASTAWTKSVQDVTNALGNVTSYYVYRTDDIQNGTGIQIQIN